MNEEKSFDETVSSLLELLQSEFNIDTPVHVLFMSPKTQCFHYSGKNYYGKLIRRLIKEGKRNSDQLTNRLNEIKKIINQSGLSKLYNFQESTSSIDPIEQFLEIFVSTPCSRHYGMIGRVYHTGVPVFCYTREQYLNSGILEFIEDDLILGVCKQDNFRKIIVESEKFIWGEEKPNEKPFADIKSAMMVPIHLYSQFVGAVFVTSEKDFDCYDYIRFIQIIKEFSITTIKDAKKYEFLSAVVQHLHLQKEGFDVIRALFINLHIIFNITGACLNYKDKDKSVASCLLFENQNDEMHLSWQEKPCRLCFCQANDMSIIPSTKLCSNSKKGLLQPRSALKMHKDLGSKSFDIILYYDIEETLLSIYKTEIKLELEDILKLLLLEEDYREKIRTIKLQNNLLSNFPHITLKYIATILLDRIKYEERNYIINYIKQRGFYLRIIANEEARYKINTADKNGIKICEEIDMLTKYNLLRKTDETLWENTNWKYLFNSNCKSCKKKSKDIEIIDPGYGKGAFYTIFENIVHNAIERGNNKITILEKGGCHKLKSRFKIIIECKINQYFVLRIGDTTSSFEEENGKKYFRPDPLVVENDDTGLGIYSIYTAGDYLSSGKKPILAFGGKKDCINRCTYTYTFHFPLKNAT